MNNIDPISNEERANWPDSIIVQLPSSFDDSRGSIQPLVDMEMKSSVLIDSNIGAVRANHYHKTDWHYCYVLFGEIIYYHRVHGSKDNPKKIVVKKGQMVFTPPMVEHSMVFEQKTRFITWGRNSRIQEIYEADVVRVPPINP
ncbi:cupin domain-containing protein [Prochlorococcus sp. AH-716-D13]|nr:cupin domain-containing protein [Prochlorococcus sp. AH-716-D13]